MRYAVILTINSWEVFMVTFVGTQSELKDAINSLIELEYEVVEAYEVALEKLNNAEYKSKMEEFCKNHRKHINLLSSLSEMRGIKPPEGPGAKSIVTKGKVYLANLFGDDTIISAMLTNEDDANDAYTRFSSRNDLWDQMKVAVSLGLNDEKKHRQWMQNIVNA